MHKMITFKFSQGFIQDLIQLPENETLEDWLAVNIVEFYNKILILYEHFSEICTDETCPKMTAGYSYEFFWRENKKIQKFSFVFTLPIFHLSLPPEYISALLDWTSNEINDTELFPIDPEVSFPNNFKKRVKLMFKRLFRFFAHVYHHHFETVRKAGVDHHLNNCYKHFLYFILRYKLLTTKELSPLKELNKRILQKDQELENNN
ncbi:mob kinase activator-like 1 [Anaeramoeba flamelloides]|uniref:Mob kinase activator-like 1 n=1 Tax=Anaeramoeba flamelloides TaxID=1746091 RepID=A0ABQ8X9Z2_9EUKA|nr:mob kinase activator-like 1 [Anaeramoeba flamelloides]